jgi:hypothetical protein
VGKEGLSLGHREVPMVHDACRIPKMSLFREEPKLPMASRRGAGWKPGDIGFCVRFTLWASVRVNV